MKTFSSYRELFGIAIRHGYWLNNGSVEFDSMNDQDQSAALRNYDMSRMLSITATTETQSNFSNQKIMFRADSSGMKIIVKTIEETLTPIIPIAADFKMTFCLKRCDFQFDSYTNLTHANKRICLFTNKQPAELVTSVTLIDKLADSALISDNFLLSEADTATMLEQLSVSERSGLIGIIQIHAKGDSSPFNLTTALDNLKVSPPQFKIHFDNKSTFWKYKKLSEDFEIETNTEKPLTKNGYIEIDPTTDFDSPSPEALTYKYPNPGLTTFESSPTKVYSVIFI